MQNVMPSLIEYMRQESLSFKQLGERIGVSRGYAHRIATGKRTPTVILLRTIHEKTGIPLKTLVYECT